MKNQQITDTQSLFAFITNQMELLSKNEIPVEAATAQAKLAKSAIHLLVYEVNRARILLEIEQAGNSEVEFRELQLRRKLKGEPIANIKIGEHPSENHIAEMDFTKI